MQRVSDESIAARIERLVDEEHRAAHARGGRQHRPGRARRGPRSGCAQVEVELDRCWDLLRQRRALRDAGADPEDAQVRDADTVERYLQ